MRTKDEQKDLDFIKDQFAIERGRESWKDLLESQEYQIDTTWVDVLMKNYADLLIKRMEENDFGFYMDPEE